VLTRYISPWIEELFKALPIIMLVHRRRIGLLVDAAIIGFAVGAGFALLENLYYLATRPDSPLFIQVIRGFGTALMHGGASAIFAIVTIAMEDKRTALGPLRLIPSYLAAVLLHSLFNHLLNQPVVAMLAMMVVLPSSMALIFRYSEHHLRQWVEADLESKIALIRMINRGEFLDSPCGRQLQKLSESFKAECRVDMLCYLRLHGELALRAKLILMMRDVGFDERLIDAETRSKLIEMKHLEASLGRTGLLALRPLMNATGRDLWQLTLLSD
jgi:hypothetical protein